MTCPPIFLSNKTPGIGYMEQQLWQASEEKSGTQNLRTLKSLEPVKKYTSVQHPTSKGITVRHWANPVKESIHHIEGAIESPHTAATNSGYSRKENGGIFYH
ncbi:hypothetical protein Chor_003788 [Crotalus horridus]